MMPVYEYRCDKCRKTYDRLFPMSTYPHQIVCPNCGKQAKQQMTLPSVVGTFKATWKFNDGLGFTPTSSKEIDRFCKKKGLVYVGDSQEIPKVKSRQRDLSDLVPKIMSRLRE